MTTRIAKVAVAIAIPAVALLGACSGSTSTSGTATPTTSTSESTGELDPSLTPAPTATGKVNLAQSDPNGYKACQAMAEWSKSSTTPEGMEQAFDKIDQAGRLALKSTTPAIKNSVSGKGPSPTQMTQACKAAGVQMPPVPDQ